MYRHDGFGSRTTTVPKLQRTIRVEGGTDTTINSHSDHRFTFK